MTEIIRLAEQVAAQAERDEAAAFDRQYELARRGERAVADLAAQGAARARAWAEDDRRDEADRRFDPEPEEPAAVARRTGGTAGRRPIRGANDEHDEHHGGEGDGPTSWLR